jgi:hypothetical protein
MPAGARAGVPKNRRPGQLGGERQLSTRLLTKAERYDGSQVDPIRTIDLKAASVSML